MREWLSMDFYKVFSMRKILLFAALVVVGCAEVKPKPQRISNETNAWLETLSDQEQFLISKSLTKR